MILMRKGRSPREQVEKYYVRKAFEREKKVREFIKEANQMREKLKEYRLDDPCNLGIDRGYIEFFNEIEDHQPLEMYQYCKYIENYIPKPPSSFTIPFIKLIESAYLQNYPDEYITLSDSYHTFHVAYWATIFTYSEGGSIEEGRLANMIGKGHDLGKSRKVLHGQTFKNPLDWVKNEDTKEWIKNNLKPIPKNLLELSERYHPIISAEVASRLASAAGFGEDTCQKIYYGSLSHEDAWYNIKGTPIIRKPESRVDVCVHDADKFQRITEILNETIFYSMKEREDLSLMVKDITRKNLHSILSGDRLSVKVLKPEQVKKRLLDHGELSLKCLETYLHALEIKYSKKY